MLNLVGGVEGEKQVAVVKLRNPNYPSPPYDPPCIYPELKNLPYQVRLDPNNEVYEGVREMFHFYGLDKENYGTQEWNPLREVISEGDVVVIKPNLVRHTHPLGRKAAISTVTHASIIRPIVDYALMALKGKGEIIICDAPLQSCIFNRVCSISGLSALMSFYKEKPLNGIKLELLDLRKEQVLLTKYLRKEIIKLSGDPLGYRIIDLGRLSHHSGIDAHWQKYSITGYEKVLGHTNKKHCYYISNTLLRADVIISVPKLKTHRKAGITACLKNFVGINASKNFLPHHRAGSLVEGGDEYLVKPSILPTLLRTLKLVMLKTPIAKEFGSLLWRSIRSSRKDRGSRSYEIGEGAWYGNDTLWRTILDLNSIVKYCDKNGRLKSQPQRKFLFIVDGVIAQEGEGPMEGKPKKCGVMMLGMNPCSIDYVAAKIMGLNYKFIKQITEPFKQRSIVMYPLVQFDITDIVVFSNVKEYTRIHELKREKSLKFSAPVGWRILELPNSE